MGPKEYGMFRCVVRYGYKDLLQDNYDFENKLVSGIVQFVERKEGLDSRPTTECLAGYESSDADQAFHSPQHANTNSDPGKSMICKDESLNILKAKESGVAYILGHCYAKSKKSSSVLKKIAIDVVYTFLSKNCRGPDVALNVPHTSLLEVGMVYYV